MNIRHLVSVSLALAIVVILFTPSTIHVDNEIPKQDNTIQIREFLQTKKSPLAQETEVLLQQKHWKLLIAISAIESQYCTRQLGNNCWGIGGDSAYRHYDSVRDAILDANALIERWQERGRWLTVDDMNCHYVQPCNPNWVQVVNKVLAELSIYDRSNP